MATGGRRSDSINENHTNKQTQCQLIWLLGCSAKPSLQVEIVVMASLSLTTPISAFASFLLQAI